VTRFVTIAKTMRKINMEAVIEISVEEKGRAKYLQQNMDLIKVDIEW